MSGHLLLRSIHDSLPAISEVADD